MQQGRNVVKESLLPLPLMSTLSASDPSPSQAKGAAGRWWLVAMGLFLALAGMTFTWVLWRAYSRAQETRAWTETPCTVIASAVRSERPSPNANMAHRAEIKYLYEIDGQMRTGTRIKRVDGATTHEERAQDVVATYAVGTQTVCYVNPADPTQTVLKQGSRAALYSIWFPLLFVVGGLGMAWNALRQRSAVS